MTQEKYIGIENEFKSFDKYWSEGFGYSNFKHLLKNNYFVKSGSSIRSDHGNGYYLDGSEIEIITPPITLNKGFSTRLTDALLIGRNYVIKNTPHFKHTGYSMHWNLSHDNSNFNLNKNRPKLMNELCIPFQLFGLTPLSCGFDVRTNKNFDRYEVMGDSITNIDQINATALLLGAYSAASETSSFKKNIFPIKTSIYTPYLYKKNMLKNGRYSEVNVYSGSKSNRKIQSTQAQNVLELFYEWINPFVYKLGEQDEINNLEAFIKGDKKLEMDDLKYFNELKKIAGINEYGTYVPLEINTRNGLRSQVLKITNDDNLEVPIEGKLLGIYATNSSYELNNATKFITKRMEWNEIMVNTKPFSYDTLKGLVSLNNLKDMFSFAETHQDTPYLTTLDTEDVTLKDLIDKKISSKLKKRIRYNAQKDLSALIK